MFTHIKTVVKELFCTETGFFSRKISISQVEIKCRVHLFKVKVKGKAIPLQALKGPEGSRGLRLPDFKILGT
jgi:hypothetical protein